MVAIRTAYVTSRTGDPLHFTSRKFRFITETSLKERGEFPYDFHYLSAREIWSQVDLSKGFWLSDLAMYRLEHEFSCPQDLLSLLEPLHSSNGTLRFFEDEFWPEIELLLGPVKTHQWHQALSTVATQGFLRQSVPQWTKERARAYLQDADAVKKRAATHLDLWQLYCQYRNAGKSMTEPQLKRWISIRDLETWLTPPSWFQDQHSQITSYDALFDLWKQHLSSLHINTDELQQKHYKLFTEAKQDL